MSVFERYLTVWVFLCIATGIALGQLLPGVFHAIGRMEVAQVNLPVGVLIWVMIIPMLMKVDFGAVHEIRKHARGIGVRIAAKSSLEDADSLVIPAKLEHRLGVEMEPHVRKIRV